MNRAEQALHQDIIRFLRVALPHGFQTDSKGSIADGPKMGGIRKSMGARAGMPDIALYGRLDGRPYAGFFEVKTKSGHLSPVQVECIDWLRDCGFDVAVVRSIDEVAACLAEWGLPARAKIR